MEIKEMTIELKNDVDDAERYAIISKEGDVVYAKVYTRNHSQDWNTPIYREDFDVIKEAMDLMGGDDG